MSAKDKSCHAASEETITGNSFGTGLADLLNLRSPEILFKGSAALCIPIATVGNEIASGPEIGCAREIILPGQQDEGTVTRRAPQPPSEQRR
jgi:hypothetical protein